VDLLDIAGGFAVAAASLKKTKFCLLHRLPVNPASGRFPLEALLNGPTGKNNK
jgi:hypothetical protein